ncbi:MAG TPA: glycosyltransferase family 39 protein [Acidisoma sp.]|uniref:glycosyltransferase family 39 protein n=1 Tax=Acidisoma sp. TaxID=1872115 RepID=UPI002C7EC2D0|nr:glycosyltransferase family 39 protein [Acidisoma sp.]HTH99406.1 glycosyltransferase family 39 protein [Acidisoma sp.]
MPDQKSLRSPALAFGFALLALTALRIGVAAVVTVSPDEAYYWVWSRAPAAGYYDHSFMVALWVRIGTWIFGPTPLGIRLLGPLSAAAASLFIFDAARKLGAGRGYAAALLLNATLLFGAGAILMTPDTPLVFFWTLTLWAMARLVAGGSGWWWIAAGIAAGLTLDSKYTGALLLAGIGLWCLALPAGRRWLRDPRAWGGLMLALVLFLPVILWNADHSWISFAKQGGRTGDFHPARALQFLGELIGGQAGLATPIIFVLCIVGLSVETVRVVRTRDPVSGLLVALGVFPALIFIEHALGDRVQGNWPEIIYPAGVIAAARLPACRRWLKPGLALGFAMALVVYVQAVASPIPIGGPGDPTVRLLGGWNKLARAMVLHAHQAKASFVAVDEYGLGSELALRLPGALPVLSDEPRWQVFSLPHPETAVPPGETGIFIRTTRRHTPPDAAPWSSMTLLGTISRGRNGRIGESYELYAVTLAPGAASLLTRLPSGAEP